jgi:hypothetical protein
MDYQMIAYSENDRTAQRLVGTWENAIDILNGRHQDSAELRDYARTYIANVVEQFTTEPTEGLWDWVAEGDWAGPVADPHYVAREWDEYERRGREDREEREACE